MTATPTTEPTTRRGRNLGPSLMTIHEIADYLGVNERHIRRLVQERRIPYIKWGHLLRFDPTAIATWLDDARVHANHG